MKPNPLEPKFNTLMGYICYSDLLPILEDVSKKTGISVKDMCGIRRMRELSEARQIFIKRAVLFFPLMKPEYIAAAAGQCRECNSLPDGNYDAFCDGIYKRHGKDYLETVIQQANNSRQTDHKWSRSELQDMIKYYKSEIKKLKHD